MVSVDSTGREGEVSSLNSTQPWLSREEKDLRRRECVHRRDKRSPSVQGQGEIEKKKGLGSITLPQGFTVPERGGKT